MEATIKIKVSELNVAFIEHFISLLGDNKDAEITITYNNHQSEYLDKLRKSKKQLDEGTNLVTFSMEELDTYTNNRRAV